MPAKRIDPRTDDKALYQAPKDQAIAVDVPDERFLMVDGTGSPNVDPAFPEAIHALYAVAYTLKFDAKARGRDFAIMPLEALWWWDGDGAFEHAPEKEWRWTLMLRVPHDITKKEVARAVATARAKGRAGVERVRLDHFREGRAMQLMHVGPYKDELPTIRRLHEEISRAGLAPSGKHHEIYLGDPRRAKPEKLRTILRQPVREAPRMRAS